MKATTSYWIFLFSSLLMHVPTVAQNDQLSRQIEQIIHFEANIDFELVPGVLVGVIDGDSNYISAFGQVLSPDSLYELGSVTKPFTAWLVHQALDSLKWHSYESICLFLPDTLCNDCYQQLTFDNVLEHRTGLPRYPAQIGGENEITDDPYSAYDDVRLSSDLLQMSPAAGTYSYSHIGYALWFWLFEELGGLDKFSEAAFSDQISLSQTEWFTDDALIAQGHGIDGRKNPAWHCQSLSTALGLKSTMHELLSFIRFISPSLAASAPADIRKWKNEMDRLSKKGEYLLADGWFLVPSGKSVIYFHTGRSGGHHVSIGFIPDSMKGVVVISNSSMGSNDLSLLVLNMIRRGKG